MNPILEAVLLRKPEPRRNIPHFRVPRMFWYLRSRRARWFRQCLNTLAWAVLVALLILAMNACNTK